MQRLAAPLEFAAATRVDALAGLQRLLTFFMSELDALGPNMSPLMLAELEQTLIASFLCSNPNNYSKLLNGSNTFHSKLAGSARGGIHRGPLARGDYH